MAAPTPAALKAELLRTLTHTLRGLEAAHADTLAAATHEEAKPENDKDTRALEQSYLARGQAARVEALQVGVRALEAMAVGASGGVVGLGALVEAEEDGEARLYFVAPEGGGTRLAKGAVLVVTPKSPLGEALVGKRAGDSSEWTAAGRTRTLDVLRVR